MKIFYTLLLILIAGCAKNSKDIVNEGKPMGVFEPKRDYVVDIPMGSSKISGESSGVEILGIFTIGAGNTADGVAISNRGDSTLGGGSNSGFDVFGATLGSAMSFLPKTSEQKFKAAALRDACEKNKCDVVGYAMYNVDSTNYFLFKTYDVEVKGFPGRVESLENVKRSYTPTDSYWRRSYPSNLPLPSKSSSVSGSSWRDTVK
jgi:hypothetical protein